jgi:hypothetical protein
MLRIGIVTATHKRQDITAIFAAKLQRMMHELKDHFEFEVVVVDSDHSNYDVLRPYNFEYYNRPNIVSDKFNYGVSKLRNLDYLLVLGSDDIVSPELLLEYKPFMEESYPIIGITDIYFQDGNKLYYWQGYKDKYRQVETIGAARAIHKSVIEQVGNLWDNGLMKGLDGSMWKRLKDYEKIAISCKQHPVIDIKSETNITALHKYKDLEEILPKFIIYTPELKRDITPLTKLINYDIITSDLNKDKVRGKVIPTYQNLIEYAKDLGHDKIVILEDDTEILVPDLDEQIKHALEHAPKNFDILLLGASYLQGNSQVNKYIYKTDRYSGNFCQIVNLKSERFLKAVEQAEVGKPLDTQLSAVNLNIFYLNPLIAKTYDNIYSSTQNKIVDYKEYWLRLPLIENKMKEEEALRLFEMHLLHASKIDSNNLKTLQKVHLYAFNTNFCGGCNGAIKIAYKKCKDWYLKNKENERKELK